MFYVFIYDVVSYTTILLRMCYTIVRFSSSLMTSVC